MPALIPCEGCRRHVRATDATCPFCGAVTAHTEARALREGRLSRAAVFASALLVPACIVQNPPPQYQQQQYQQQPPPYEQQQPPPPDPSDPERTYAQPPPGDPPPPPAVRTGSVRGQLLDSNGSVLAGYRIALMGPRGELVELTTDRSGTFVFAQVPEGDHTLLYDGGGRTPVHITAGSELRVAPVVQLPRAVPYDRHNVAKPYGAPPARRRVV